MTRHVGMLPAEVSSFVDRRWERAELKRLLTVSRLVTVTGVGGVGKTRTALRVAMEVRRAFPDGVWWVELSALADPALLAQTVAEALDVQDQTARPQLQALADHLAGRRLLLVLDTCEHLVNACAELTDTLLRAAPQLRVLATSRQPLDVAGEHLFALAPLPVSTSEGWNGEGRSDSQPGVELFVERARAVDAGFALTETNRAAVAALCRHLDGIPLAIELAAVRLRALSVHQLLALLGDRFRLLNRGSRTGFARHETLRAAIGWSHQLCTPTERVLWARVSVFAGDFDLPAVEAVCADDRLPAAELLDLVAGLVDKSILLRAEYPAAVRYRLLDTIRAYGQELLHTCDEPDALRRRHRDYYLQLARRCKADWCGPDQEAWCQRLHREHTNLRAALEFCLTQPGEHQAGLELAATLRSFWMACGFVREGRHYLDRALALDPAPGPTLTTALWSCASLALAQGDLTAVDVRLAQCRPHAERHGDVTALGWIAFITGTAALFRGDPARAIALGEHSADLHRHGGDPGTGLLQALLLQAMALAVTGAFDRVVTVADECRAICDRTGERWSRSYIDYVRAFAEMGRGHTTAAETYARDAVRFKRLLRDNAGLAMALDLLAAVAAARGQPARAARLLGLAHQVWHTFGLPQFGSADLAVTRQQCERAARTALDDQRYEAAFQAGLHLDIDAGISYALDEPQPRQHTAPSSDPKRLTHRENEIARLVGDGLTNPQIAARLVIAKRTVDSHIEHILAKLGLTNRAQIAAWVSGQRPTTDDAADPIAPDARPGPPIHT